ncbi:MAG: hypothetical protein G01um101430_27 [Parcubacteria group bacterium Gr01-1014_30]|nr:MAG: hypothetical protein G01um101430_27 [Parcubacteria group bacterium Gr01-1014_30]
METKFSKFAIISFIISVLVFTQAVIAFMDIPETHPLASVLFPIILIAYLPDYPLGYLPQHFGFPIVLPLLGIIFSLISFRRENKKILSITSLILIIAGITLFLVLRFLPESKLSEPKLTNIPISQTTKIETLNWQAYRNDKYRFEIKYPPTIEPLEGQALFYRPPEFSPLLNICFASVERAEFYCEVELYIAPSFVASPQNLEFLNANSFLGLNRCVASGLRPQPKFDGIQGSEIDTCGEEGMHRNVFVTKDDFLYIISTEPEAGYATGKDATFEGMINSFKFINL